MAVTLCRVYNNEVAPGVFMGEDNLILCINGQSRPCHDGEPKVVPISDAVALSSLPREQGKAEYEEVIVNADGERKQNDMACSEEKKSESAAPVVACQAATSRSREVEEGPCIKPAGDHASSSSISSSSNHHVEDAMDVERGAGAFSIAQPPSRGEDGGINGDKLHMVSLLSSSTTTTTSLSSLRPSEGEVKIDMMMEEVMEEGVCGKGGEPDRIGDMEGLRKSDDEEVDEGDDGEEDATGALVQHFLKVFGKESAVYDVWGPMKGE